MPVSSDQSDQVTRALLLVMALGATARADVTVEVAGGAPFTPDELRAALRVRLGGRPAHVTVHTTDDGVAIATGGGERDVPLAGRAGPDAARLVALVAVDLLLPDLATPPALEAAMPEPRGRPLSVGAFGSVSQWSGPLAGGRSTSRSRCGRTAWSRSSSAAARSSTAT